MGKRNINVSKDRELFLKSGEEELQNQFDDLKTQLDKLNAEKDRLELTPKIYQRRINNLESKIKKLTKKMVPRMNRLNKIRGETAEFIPLESKIEDSKSECGNLKLAECGSYTI